jgi:hypothetical protein
MGALDRLGRHLGRRFGGRLAARIVHSCSSSVQEAWLYAEPDRPAGPETQGSVASRWLVIAAITSGMSG